MASASFKLRGAHRVKKHLADGRVAIYWYRWRGGPFVMKFEGKNAVAALLAESEGSADLAVSFRSQPQPKRITVRDIVIQYRAAPNGFCRLAESTKKRWAPYLDKIIETFGDLPANALKARGVRSKIIAWRDSQSKTPRSADYAIQVLNRVLSFAVDRELADTNPAKGIEGIYRNSRADQIVEEHEIVALIDHVSYEASLAIRLAAATGIRRGDLVSLQWSHISDNSILFPTGKSGGKTSALVPIFPSARVVIDELRAKRTETIASGTIPAKFVLTTRFGTPWTKDGLTQAFIRGARKAGVNKHLHDLRGTAATRLVRAGLSDQQIADIFGWEPAQVSKIKRHYVQRDEIARGVIDQLERNERTV